jgi:hypothetical protein
MGANPKRVFWGLQGTNNCGVVLGNGEKEEDDHCAVVVVAAAASLLRIDRHSSSVRRRHRIFQQVCSDFSISVLSGK